MVVDVAAFPWENKFWIYDVEHDKFEEKLCNITVREWEANKADEYFTNITEIIQKPIDSFYLIVDWDYYNEILQKFVEASKEHKIFKFKIMKDFQKNAISALQFVNDHSDSIWLFSCFSHDIFCAIWEKNDSYQLNISQIIFQNRTTCDQNLMAADFRNLKKKICSSSKSATIIVYQNVINCSENTFKNVFNDYSKIHFDYSNLSLYDFLYIIEKQKLEQIAYKVQPVLGRIIQIKFGETFIETLHRNCVVPYQKEYSLDVEQRSTRLKVYEEGALTQNVNLNEHGDAKMLKFEIDRNGIFTLTFKRIGKNIDFFRPPKSLSFQNKRILKIPSKLFEYNKGLNAVGIDLGTVECCAFVIRRNGPEGVILDPVTNNRNLQSYVDINEINEPCGQLIVNRMETKSKFSAFDVKRLIGKELHEIEIDPLWPYKVINYCEQIYLLFDGDNDPCPYVKSSVEIT